MSKNQLHGKTFEKIILDSFNINESKKTSVFDVNDPCLKYPISIKTTEYKGNDTTIYLSDASRVWNWDKIISLGKEDKKEEASLCIILGLYNYNKEETVKIFKKINVIKINLNKNTKSQLYGSLSLSEIFALHLKIGKDFFDSPEKAREFAQKVKENFLNDNRFGFIKINPKIDSKNQRRLQCSIKLEDLLKIKSEENIEHIELPLKNIILPLEIESSRRERKKK